MVNILRYSVALKYLLKERKMSEDYLAKKLKKDPSSINRWKNYKQASFMEHDLKKWIDKYKY